MVMAVMVIVVAVLVELHFSYS